MATITKKDFEISLIDYVKAKANFRYNVPIEEIKSRTGLPEDTLKKINQSTGYNNFLGIPEDSETTLEEKSWNEYIDKAMDVALLNDLRHFFSSITDQFGINGD